MHPLNWMTITTPSSGVLGDRRPPVSVIEIHGTADQLVAYEGAHTAGGATKPSPPTAAVAERWAEQKPLPVPPGQRDEQSCHHVDLERLRQGSVVKLVTIDGGGHT